MPKTTTTIPAVARRRPVPGFRPGDVVRVTKPLPDGTAPGTVATVTAVQVAWVPSPVVAWITHPATAGRQPYAVCADEITPATPELKEHAA